MLLAHSDYNTCLNSKEEGAFPPPTNLSDLPSPQKNDAGRSSKLALSRPVRSNGPIVGSGDGVCRPSGEQATALDHPLRVSFEIVPALGI